MRATRWLTVALAATIAVTVAHAIPIAKQCKRSCGPAISACVAEGGRRKKCKKQTLKRCRQEGIAACESSSTTTTLPDGSTTTTTTSPGGTTTTTTAEGVHGCNVGNAVDLRMVTADRTVTFAPYAYTPKCIRIREGENVTFSGSFEDHPLAGGQIVGMNEVPDDASPIGVTASGATKDIPFPASGTYPYFCVNHGPPPTNMFGAVIVEP
jgi:plastocyanin